MNPSVPVACRMARDDYPALDSVHGPWPAGASEELDRQVGDALDELDRLRAANQALTVVLDDVLARVSGCGQGSWIDALGRWIETRKEHGDPSVGPASAEVSS